ncbi:carboxylesterase/lipase family protein [Luteimonas deserti]|uniref:Carboxylic ester hydrolase n=1 Tax=Luteimonas deserti TaxID=2752306 RepID=A0A7Z0QPA8_9GAMM|nr:carboxylesterase/lipase family protein [Luteimonas deserti]NYZ62306.1 carboxylesterase/lipase family protein [Luteimonas deserti]
MTDPSDPQRRRWLLAGAGTAACLALPVSAMSLASPQTTLARVRSGRIAGTVEDGIHVFRGIPYGADTAARRWQAATREPAWRGVRDALDYGPSAPQRGGEGPGSEDCLRVNVWTPALRDGARRPILVYIHGGGFTTGSGSDPLYDGGALCRSGDVVVITLNHRLNAFGYLHLRDLGDASFAHAGNVGQLDLIQALEWVQQHADEFGGDAGNVTVFGQSGGGAKIATLMAMPAARGLFHRAWTMSGQQVTAAGPRAATQRAELFLGALNVAPSELARLRSLPMQALLDAQSVRDPSRVESSALYFGPVVDTVNLPRHPFWPDAPPQSAHIPMVIGNTRDETRAFLGNDPDNFALTWDTLPARLRTQHFVDLDPVVVVAEYRRLYPDYTPSEVFFAATTAGRSWRGAVEELEVRAAQGTNTWAYQLDWYPRTDEGARLRAFHTLDIPLVFGNTGVSGAKTGDGEDARAVAATMRDALLAFARNGDPNHAGMPTWTPYSMTARETMVFDATARLEHDPRGGERMLYRQAPFLQRGTQ